MTGTGWSDDGLPPELRPMTVAELVVDDELDHEVLAQLLGGRLRSADAVHHAGLYVVPYPNLDGVAGVYADQERVATMNVDAIVTGAHLIRALEVAAEEGAEAENDDQPEADDDQVVGAWYQ